MNPSSPSLDLLKAVRKTHSQAQLAKQLNVTTRHLRRWERGEALPPPHVLSDIRRMLAADEKGGEFTFIDLFAGIGGIRLAFQDIGGVCVFTSEWDEYAQRSYAANYKGNHLINGDITQVEASAVPDHDVLLAGFPCQPFSIAGVSKKNALGRAHGFHDETQGTLFFDVARIIDEKRPKAFLLENVKNLVSHDKGNADQSHPSGIFRP